MATSRKQPKSQLKNQSFFSAPSTLASPIDQDVYVNLVIEYVADQIDLRKLLGQTNKNSDDAIIESLDLDHRKKLKASLEERLGKWYYLSARAAWEESGNSVNRGLSSAGFTSMLFGWASAIFVGVTAVDQGLNQIQHRIKVNKRAQDFVELIDKLTPELVGNAPIARPPGVPQ